MKLFKSLGLAALIATTSLTVAHAETDKSTKDFVEKAAISGIFEVESSKLALQKSQNAEVKTFAQTMVDDHMKANNELKAAIDASKAGVAVPTALDDKHAKLLKDLNKKSGKDFDKAYAEAQEDAHDDAVDLFEDYAKDGKNAELKAFAGKTLPTLEQHEEHADDLKDKV